jgi:hypothetical protein
MTILANASLQTIMNSSISAFLAAGGNNYTGDFARTRAQSALASGSTDPLTAGLNWEGIFNIPVCDVSAVALRDSWHNKGAIHQTYGKKKMLSLCGPVCSQSQNETDSFFESANMKDFKSHRFSCP